jgi:hypothetical protein
VGIEFTFELWYFFSLFQKGTKNVCICLDGRINIDIAPNAKITFGARNLWAKVHSSSFVVRHSAWPNNIINNVKNNTKSTKTGALLT